MVMAMMSVVMIVVRSIHANLPCPMRHWTPLWTFQQLEGQGESCATTKVDRTAQSDLRPHFDALL